MRGADVADDDERSFTALNRVVAVPSEDEVDTAFQIVGIPVEIVAAQHVVAVAAKDQIAKQQAEILTGKFDVSTRSAIRLIIAHTAENQIDSVTFVRRIGLVAVQNIVAGLSEDEVAEVQREGVVDFDSIALACRGSVVVRTGENQVDTVKRGDVVVAVAAEDDITETQFEVRIAFVADAEQTAAETGDDVVAFRAENDVDVVVFTIAIRVIAFDRVVAWASENQIAKVEAEPVAVAAERKPRALAG